MKERRICGEVLKRVRDEMKISCAVEVKVAHRGHAIAFAVLEEHQERALKLAAGVGMYFKIPDGSMSATPFDGFILCGAPAYVAVLWPKMMQHRETLTLVSIQDWISEREVLAAQGQKSLSRERAVALSQLK